MKARALTAALVAAAVALLILFAALPLSAVIARGLGLPGALTLSPIGEAFLEPASRRAIANTVLIAVLVAAFATALGAPLGFILARFDLRFARPLRTVLTLPAVVPPYLMGIAWIDLANPRTGLLNQAAFALGASGPILDCYSIGGIVWVLSSCFFPLVMLPVLSTLERMDASLEEVARVSGAGPWRALRDVTLPLAVPAISSGAVLVFLATAATFGVPYLLGTAGTRRIEVLTTAIVNHITVGGEGELSSAMALSLLLLILSALAAGAGELATRGGRRFAIVSGKGARPRPIGASARLRRLLLLTLIATATVTVFLPIATLGWVSLLKAWGAGLGPSNWSLDNYQRVLFERRDTVPAVGRSLLLALGASTLAVSIGGLIAYLRRRRPSWWTRGLEAMANTPYAVPGTVLALGLILTWSREVRVIVFERMTLGIDLFGGAWALLAAYAVKYLAFGVRLIGSGLLGLDPALEEAARTAGASRLRAAIDVVAPLLASSLAAAWLLVFLPTLSEITMSVLLAGPGTAVIGTLLFELQSYADPPSAAVLACLLLLLTLSGNALLRRVTRGRGGF